MPVTVLYPEERQIPDDDLEREIFGSEVRILRRPAKTLAELDPAECAEADGLMIMRYAVTPEDLELFPRLRPRLHGISWFAMCRITARPRSPTTPWPSPCHCAAG